MHWVDRRAGVANLGKALRALGWTLHGWTDDKSDSMTDYYAPEHWAGIASMGDVVCVVDKRQALESGQPIHERTLTAGPDCQECRGTGNDPSGETLEQARAIPGRVVSPIQYNGQGWGAGIPEEAAKEPAPRRGTHGVKRCRTCSGRGWMYGEPVVAEVGRWPTFRANPPRRLWHVEVGGTVLASGVGIEACSRDRDGKAAALKLAQRITASAEGRGARGDVAPREVDRIEVSINEERQGVEIRFPEKPSEDVRGALKRAGFRWSRFSACWYKKRSEEAERFAEELAGRAVSL